LTLLLASPRAFRFENVKVGAREKRKRTDEDGRATLRFERIGGRPLVVRARKDGFEKAVFEVRPGKGGG
jgi:hypothetical protein